MSKEGAGAGGAGNNEELEAGGDGDKKKSVSHETYSRVLDQHKASQKKLEDIQTELETLRAERKKREDDEKANVDKKNLDAGNWKQLLDDRDKRIKELEGTSTKFEKENKKLKNDFTDMKKIAAFNDKIGGRMELPEYYSFVDTSKIALDPETGKIDENSLQNYASEFLKSPHKKLVKFFGAGSGLPGGAAQGGQSSISHDEWMKLPPKEKRLRMKDVK